MLNDGKLNNLKQLIFNIIECFPSVSTYVIKIVAFKNFWSQYSTFFEDYTAMVLCSGCTLELLGALKNILIPTLNPNQLYRNL